MTDSIQISAVIPTYNRARLVGRAIESALNQTKRPFEIIVVDDGSQDNTRAVVEAYGDLLTCLSQKNLGSAAARNRGIKTARSHWVALLDSDDVWVETHLERMAGAIEQTQGRARFYFADTQQPVEKGGGSRWASVGFRSETAIALETSAADWVLMRPQPMMLQSTVFNRKAFLDAGGFLPALRYRDDTHLFLKLGLDGPICAVAGISTRMMSDDDPNNRLTLTYDDQLNGATMQVIMFSDLLKTMHHLPADVRMELRRRLATAHLSVARHNMKAKRFGTSLSQVARSVRVQPAVFYGTLFQKIKGAFFL